jgi:hypothetical protein
VARGNLSGHCPSPVACRLSPVQSDKPHARPSLACPPPAFYLSLMVLLRLYADCLRRAFAGARRSPWTLGLPIVYLAINLVAGIVLSPFGLVGSFALVIVADLCTSSFLYFVGQTVAGSPSRPSELKDSLLAYFWPVVSFYFVVWVANWVLDLALAANPQKEKIELALAGVAFVLLNAVPEVIYQKSEVSGLRIVGHSVRFIQTQWIEWFIPNLLLVAAIVGATVGLMRVPFGLYLEPLVVGALSYFAFLFRGNLFYLLDNHSPHQLKLRYRGRPAA